LLSYSISALLLLRWKDTVVKVHARQKHPDIFSRRLRLLCISISSASYFLGIKTPFSWPLWGNSGSTIGDLELPAKVTAGTEESIGKQQLSMHTSSTVHLH